MIDLTWNDPYAASACENHSYMFINRNSALFRHDIFLHELYFFTRTVFFHKLIAKKQRWENRVI